MSSGSREEEEISDAMLIGHKAERFYMRLTEMEVAEF